MQDSFRLDHAVRKMKKKMAKFIVLLQVLHLAFGLHTLDNEEHEIDPFDMINFDIAAMKMRKDQSPPKEQSAGARTDEEQDQVIMSGGEVHINPTTADGPPLSRETPAKSVSVSYDLSPTTVQSVSVEVVEPIACPGLSLFRQFVTKLLKLVDHSVHEMDAAKPVELCLHVRLTPNQLSELQSFSRDTSGNGVHAAHDVLTEAILSAYRMNADGSCLHTLWLEDKLGLSLEKLTQVLFLIVLVITAMVMLSKVHFSFTLIVWIFFAGFVTSVATTWYRLYQGEVAKQHEAVMKDPPSGCSKLPEHSGVWQSLVSLSKGYFSFQKDECIEYYEHLIIDPLVKVSIMEALAVAVVQTALKPLRTVGTEFSQFLRALLKDLPVQWQLGSLLIFLMVVFIILVFCCGYRVRVPLLLTIEPAPPPVREQVSESKPSTTFQKRLTRLESAIENIAAAGTAHQISEQLRQLPVKNSKEINTKQRLCSDSELFPNTSLSVDEELEDSLGECNSSVSHNTRLRRVCREHKAEENEHLDISTVGRGPDSGDEQTLP